MYGRNSSAAVSPACTGREEGDICSRKHWRGHLAHLDHGGQELDWGGEEGADLASEHRWPSLWEAGGCSLSPSLSLSTPRDSALISLQQGLYLFFRFSR